MGVAEDHDTLFVTTSQDDKVAAINDLALKALAIQSQTHTDATDAAITITAAEATEHAFFEFTGTLTANRLATFPAAYPGLRWLKNSTSGAFALTATVSGGSNVITLPRDSWILLKASPTEFEELSRNLIVLSSEVLDLTSATPLEFVSPVEGRLHRVDSVATVAATVADCVMTTQINTTTITNGGLTIPFSGSAIGDTATSGTIEDGQANPNTLAAGDRIQLTSDTGPTVGSAKFFISIEPRIV